MTEKEKQLAGMIYDASTPELVAEMDANKLKIQAYNNMPPTDVQARDKAMREILGSAGKDCCIVQPFYCDYGTQIHFGDGVFANFNFTVLDEAPVRIGNDCFIGPNVSIYTACHSTIVAERNTRQEWAEPVTIGDNCWIAGSVTILPGVTIGSGTTIGAGSVVTRDIPANVIAVGNPCRVLREIPRAEPAAAETAAEPKN